MNYFCGFRTGSDANRRKLGITAEKMSTTVNFFHNDFVSKILYNPPEVRAEEREEQYCLEKLDRVAVVDISFTHADAIVLKQSLESKTSIWTNTGGLLSLYVGFSFLSLGEIVFWLLRSLVRILYLQNGQCWRRWTNNP